MKLKDLIKKLQEKPDQENEVNFVVFEPVPGGNLVTAELTGKGSMKIMKLLAELYPDK